MNRKIYISADIEGNAGACTWKLEDRNSDEYHQQRNILKQEILAAVSEINRIDSSCQITIKDAHSSGCNYDVTDFPANCEIVRGWDDGPLCMMQELDETYSAVILLGYHSCAGTDLSPLAHTFSSLRYSKVTLNGKLMSEFLISFYIAGMYQVPVVMLSGDLGICQEAEQYNAKIKTAAVQRGRGASVISVSEEKAELLIRGALREAFGEKHHEAAQLPEYFVLDITYFSHAEANKRAYYPGCKKIDAVTVRFEHKDFREILRALLFL